MWKVLKYVPRRLRYILRVRSSGPGTADGRLFERVERWYIILFTEILFRWKPVRKINSSDLSPTLRVPSTRNIPYFIVNHINIVLRESWFYLNMHDTWLNNSVARFFSSILNFRTFWVKTAGFFRLKYTM